MTNPAAPPGWYPDPSGNGTQSYWDGRSWQAGPPAAPAAPAGGWGAAAPAPPGAQPGAAPFGVPAGYGQPAPYQAAGYPPAVYQQPGYQPGYQQSGYPPQPYMGMVSPKNPAVALILSFFWPGAGHLYVEGPTTRAILLMVGTFVSLFLLLVFIGFLTLLGLVIWTMIESYGLAKQWNVAHGFPPG